MATERKLRRGTAAEHDLFTGAVGEVTVVTDDSTLRVHDGVTPGGKGLSDNPVVSKGSTAARTLSERFADITNVKDFGAVGDGSTDDATAIQAAHDVHGYVNYLKGDYVDSRDGTFPVFNLRGLVGGEKRKMGEWLTPTDDRRPAFWSEKFSSVSRNVDPSTWDAGAGYFSLFKTGGDAYNAVTTSFGQHLGGEGQLIAGHMRAQGTHPEASVFGAWPYADANVSSGYVKEIIGMEINLRNRGDDVVRNPPAGQGLYRGLNILPADGSNVCNIALDIGTQTSTGSAGWFTGIRLREDGIVPTSTYGQSEQLLIEGGSTRANRYGGIKFESGYFDYGIDFTGADEYNSNAAIILGYGNKVTTSLESSRYFNLIEAGALFNLNNFNLAINGTAVVGEQKDAISDATEGTEIVTINNILNRLRAHGLIAS